MAAGEIYPIIGASIGLVSGETADYLASKFIARKRLPAAVSPTWTEDLLPIPEIDDTEKASRFQRIKDTLAPFVTYLAAGTAAVGFSAGAILMPPPPSHTVSHVNLGVVVDRSGYTINSLTKSGPDIYSQINSELTGLEKTKASLNVQISSQGLISPGTVKGALAAPEIGQVNLADGIENALRGDDAIVVLTGQDQVSSSIGGQEGYKAVANAAKLSNEKVYVLDDTTATDNTPVANELKYITKTTGGAFFDASQSNISAVVKAATQSALPKTGIETLKVDQQKWPWIAMLAISALGSGFALKDIWTGRRLIRRSFKNVEEEK